MTGPNGQAAHAALVAQWRDATRRLRAAATAANDAADAVLSTGPRPGMAQAVYDCAADLRDLSHSGTRFRLCARMPHALWHRGAGCPA